MLPSRNFGTRGTRNRKRFRGNTTERQALRALIREGPDTDSQSCLGFIHAGGRPFPRTQIFDPMSFGRIEAPNRD